MPDVSGVTVVTNACAYLTAHAAADAPSVRHSLRPLFFWGSSTQQLGRIASRECGGVAVWGDVIARSEATKQSSLSCGSMDCFASLAMTVQGCLTIESETRDPAERELSAR
jgi:hypothetical protein